ncbi:hypothetical protein HLV37_05725 [Eggerthellaceae bacterium zg-1084]|uniref:Uncharacterized protein n=1 Tax=Berryella wangjianweii TaxID=2734634 RepID=A0A6M8J5E0_9ACTN|nr:hypothetical protein [Berryella wangjianweii]NPD31361.1 hypothetical protein [Berryella wangjianweii]NPD32332.1 hypothetical protein [Eggerthellaceae bacterium zg-997]QKF06898.1 hypothetical protein HLV38_01250 [Berryella wangjianweii]
MNRTRVKKFSFTKLSHALESGNERLKPYLFLYAYEAGQTDRLRDCLKKEALRAELERIVQIMGGRPVQELALRGTPLRLLPAAYQECLDAFDAAYHAPEMLAEQKRTLWEETIQLQREKGITNSMLYQQLKLNPGNANAYLKDGAVEKLSIDNARALRDLARRHPGATRGIQDVN